MMMERKVVLYAAAYFSLLLGGVDELMMSSASASSQNNDGGGQVEEVHVGLILDMGSMEGKIIHSCVSMAISDLSLQRERDQFQSVRIVLHTRDSKGHPLHALSDAFSLLENAKVGVILSAQTSILEAKLLAELGDKAKIPIISFSTFASSPSLHNHPYFIQIAQHETAELEGVAAIVELHNWENVILIYDEDNNDIINWSDHNFFEKRKFRIAYKWAVAASCKDDGIVEQLHKLKALHTTVFIVHASPLLASRLFLHAKRLGMMSKGYAWIVTSKSMNHLDLTDSSSISDSMQGILGFRSYNVTVSKELRDFTSRLRKHVYNKQPHMLELDEMSTHITLYGVWAYDVARSLAKVAEAKVVEVPHKLAGLNLTDLNKFGTHFHSSILWEKIVQNYKFEGLIGEYQFINGKLMSASTFEIVNVIGEGGTKRVGFWTSPGKITNYMHGRHLSSVNEIETIIWPGETSTIPKGRMMQTSSNILRIGVPVKKGFTQLVKVDYDPETNATIATGFCIDVFQAAWEGLKYGMQYQYIPYVEDYNTGKTYDDLVYQVYLQNFDAVVGDTTITANRSLYVDFTMPYTEIGVGIVAPKQSKNMWIFLKPLTRELWLTIVGIYFLTASIIWLIERPTFAEQDPQSHRKHVGRMFCFSFSILVFSHWEKLSSNLSRSIVLVWVVLVFILSSSYTATLTSMMTVHQIELNSKRSNIEDQVKGPITQQGLSNLNFENTNSLWLLSTDEYVKALSNGSRSGGFSAIIDEIPYIKIFLAQFSTGYSMITSMPITNGFGFVFRKGSPLVPEISREIAKLRESGRLEMIENAWFKSPTSTFDSGDNSNRVDPLSIADFGGLFLISGTFSALAFLLFLASLLYRNRHRLRIWTRPEFVKQYVSIIIFKRIKKSNVIHAELGNL